MKERIFGEYFSAMIVLQTDHYNFHLNCIFVLSLQFLISTESKMCIEIHPVLFYARYRTIEYWEPTLFINIYTFDCNFRSGSFFVHCFFFSCVSISDSQIDSAFYILYFHMVESSCATVCAQVFGVAQKIIYNSIFFRLNWLIYHVI